MERSNSSTPAGLDTFDHVVVLMLENRSFDNLLGYLYEDGVPAGKKFNGLQTGTFKNPVPKRAKDYKNGLTIEVGRASDYHQPFPDPGEVYPHINTQLYNIIDKDNIGVEGEKMHPPYNVPYSPAHTNMEGFVNDYINVLQALGKQHPDDGKKYINPTIDLYKVIMQCFKPDQVNVLSSLAREFAVFDDWHCSVPSQTWCNRAFWHAATSGGKVVNPDPYNDPQSMVNWQNANWYNPTIFDRLASKNLSAKIYSDNTASLTRMIHGYLHTPSSYSTDQFKIDIGGNDFPAYCFIEPVFMGVHNDQHPSSFDDPNYGKTTPGTVLLGEKLIWDVYTTIKQSKYRDKTLLIITHDEHGGCYDHVSPLPAVRPDKSSGEMGFGFTRLGIRVPMVMVSAYIGKETIINDPYDHSSFIKTMSKKWQFNTLTERDKKANSFEAVFSGTKRTFPDIPAPVIKDFDEDAFLDRSLNDLQRSILGGADHIARINREGESSLKEFDASNIRTNRQALEYMERIKQYIL